MTIYIAQHKPYWTPALNGYSPIQVGAVNKNNIFLKLRDDIGENISIKNPVWCEMTALYWIWKHDEISDFIGLCHYRRYFAFGAEKNILAKKFVEKRIKHKMDPSIPILKKDLDKEFFSDLIETDSVTSWLQDYDVILPAALILPKSVKEDFIKAHGEESYLAAKDVIHEYHPNYDEAFEKTFSGNKVYLLNMFIMSRSLYQEYAQWIFSILFEVEKRIHISSDPYQKRIIGFLAERLLNVWLRYKSLRVKEIPIIFVHEEDKLRYKILSFSMEVASKLSNK